MAEVGEYPPRSRGGAKRKYPWDEMAVGEHFTVRNRTLSSFTGTLAYANASREPRRFRSRKVGENLEIRRSK